METNPNNVNVKQCKKCNQDKELIHFYSHHNKNICKNCLNESRRNKYSSDESFRNKKIKESVKHKQIKKEKRDLTKQQYQEQIGIDNKLCKYCKEIKPKSRFRHNRLKCKDCERDNPTEKLKRNVRGRIHYAVNKKELHTEEYLGCSNKQYLKWLLNYNPIYNLDNRCEWHIDHVIPLSTFNLNDLEQQLIAFNWRNTMPFSAVENLSKNNKILQDQVKNHYEKLIDYHDKNNIIMPQEFIDLFSNITKLRETSLEPSLPPNNRNIIGELG